MNEQTKELTIEALTENVDEVQEFVRVEMERLGASERAIMMMDIAVEEIFVNIASYAYTPETGPAHIEVSSDEENITVTFTDEGRPFDPLAREDPDITLPADRRRIGGLGIFMAKKGVTDIRYEYRDNKNVLTIHKTL